MTIASTNSRNDYTGNGSVATYSYNFKIFDKADLLLTVKNLSNVETTLTLTTDYTVSGVGNTGGGSITLVNSGQAWLTGGFLTTGFKLSIRRVVSLLQNTDIRNQGDFFPEIHEDALDYLTMIDQKQQDELDRSVKLPESIAGSTFNTELPANLQAGRVIAINTTADGFAVTTDVSNLITFEATAAAAAANAATASAAAASATSSAASAAASAATLANFVVAKGFADTPVTVSLSDKGKLYYVDTTNGVVTFNLPTPTASFYIRIKDKAGAFGLNKCTAVRNGSELFEGLASNYDMRADYGEWYIVSDGTNYFLG